MSDIRCPDCGSTNFHRRGFYPDTRKAKFRCTNCRRSFQEGSLPKTEYQTHKVEKKLCPNCGQTTTNPKFCSIPCAAAYNLQFVPPKQRKQRFCKDCGQPVEGRITKCADCKRRDGQIADWNTRTLGDVQASTLYQAHAAIRRLARRIYFASDLPRACNRCGYDKHFEVCHIQPINSFSSDTTIATINNLSNLIALCPNCHWEFDHGLLRLEEISPYRPTT